DRFPFTLSRACRRARLSNAPVASRRVLSLRAASLAISSRSPWSEASRSTVTGGSPVTMVTSRSVMRRTDWMVNGGGDSGSFGARCGDSVKGSGQATCPLASTISASSMRRDGSPRRPVTICTCASRTDGTLPMVMSRRSSDGGKSDAPADTMWTVWPRRAASCASSVERTRSPCRPRLMAKYSPAVNATRMTASAISARLSIGRSLQRPEIHVERAEPFGMRGEPRREGGVILTFPWRPHDLGERRQPRIRHVLDVFWRRHVLGPQLRLRPEHVLRELRLELVRQRLVGVDRFDRQHRRLPDRLAREILRLRIVEVGVAGRRHDDIMPGAGGVDAPFRAAPRHHHRVLGEPSLEDLVPADEAAAVPGQERVH